MKKFFELIYGLNLIMLKYWTKSWNDKYIIN